MGKKNKYKKLYRELAAQTARGWGDGEGARAGSAGGLFGSSGKEGDFGEGFPGGGMFKTLGGALQSAGTRQFLVGALVGAAAGYILSDEKLRSKIVKTALKMYGEVTGGFEEMKERMADLKAEMDAKQGTPADSGE